MRQLPGATPRRLPSLTLAAVALLLGALVALPEARSAGAATPPTIVTFAGDIAKGVQGTPDFLNAQATANRVKAIGPRYALTGGDNAYPSGTATDFATKYHPTWGGFKAITKPSPGNHDYYTAGATGYFGYFKGQIAGKAYYAFDLGAGWRAYSLNCEISCGLGSPQHTWLRNDLASHPGRHYLVYLHRARFTTGPHPPHTGVSAIWSTVNAAGGDLVLSGHNHQYERFSKQDANGGYTPSGMIQFVAGAGGAGMYGFVRTSAETLARNATDFGVLRLTLRRGTYSWRYVGSGRCWNGGGSYSCPARTGMVLDSGTRNTNNPA